MRATILMDNLAARGLEAEWGLSIYVEYQGHAILLDTGASDRFARNADALGIDLSTVSFGVLSHAHWDLICPQPHRPLLPPPGLRGDLL